MPFGKQRTEWPGLITVLRLHGELEGWTIRVEIDKVQLLLPGSCPVPAAVTWMKHGARPAVTSFGHNGIDVGAMMTLLQIQDCMPDRSVGSTIETQAALRWVSAQFRDKPRVLSDRMMLWSFGDLDARMLSGEFKLWSALSERVIGTWSDFSRPPPPEIVEAVEREHA